MPDLYFDFENKFRGSRKEVEEKLTIYDELLDYIFSISNNPTALDIGSGRGEWLQKCSEKGFDARGIEINSEMIKESNKYNLTVLNGDAIEILQKIPNQSISFVTAFHVIEHLSHDQIEILFKECRRIVSNNGICLFETPSIDNLIVSTKSFYLDPTHKNPINPDYIKYLLSHLGFEKVKYYYLNGGPLSGESNFTLTRVLNGVAQDLLILAIKSSTDIKLVSNQISKWESNLNVGITTFQASEDFDNQLMKNISFLKNSITNLENEVHHLKKINLSLQSEQILIKKQTNQLYRSSFIYSIRVFSKAKKIIKYFVNIYKVIFTKLFRKLYLILSSIPFVRSFVFSSKSYIIFKPLLYLLKAFGQESYFLKITDQLDQLQETVDESSPVNDMLIPYYQSSDAAKQNYKELTAELKDENIN
tara:strand:+ start:4110 stop:5366 length:1257 start_codon:yes stop_codon:yes gene_type:complete